MRRVSRSILLTFSVASLVGCSDRDLRPLTPCTTSGASGNVPIQSLKNVDLVFLVDNSNSMASEQQKLRNEFPSMIRALMTGDVTGPGGVPDNVPDGPAVESLRVAVITSDMGVLGVGSGDASTGTPIQNCGATLVGAARYARAQYGDDGIFRTRQNTLVADPPGVPVGVSCDSDGDGTGDADGMDDTVAVARLPAYLTFDNPGGDPLDTAPEMAELTEFNRRVSCLTNVGVSGCVFEQQLEALLKAITPAGDAPEGGAFYSAAGEEAAHGVGHGDDPLTNDADMDGDGVGWFRDDSLLALVMVSDEDDCSANNRLMFDLNANVAPWNQDMPDQFVKSQTRCPRFENEGLWPVERYIKGFIARRSLSPGAFVFAAITGVPEDLTDEVISLPNQDPVVEGTDNLQAILDDTRMQYNYVANGAVAGATIAFACEHFDDNFAVTVHADAANASTSLVNVTVTDVAATPTSKMATAGVTNASATLTNFVMAVPGQTPEEGMSVTGTNIPAGAVIVSSSPVTGTPAVDDFNVTISAPATGTGAATALTIGANLGPAVGHFAFGTGIPAGTRVSAVSGSNPYTITLSQAVTTAANADIQLMPRDVEAVPARRAVRVAQGLVSEPYFSNATIQSICVDSFRPAVQRIIALIQQNLRGSCLPRPLIRNAANEVNCDVFVTMPPNVSCADPSLNGAYEQTAVRTAVAPDNAGDADGLLDVCTMLQVPVTAADKTSDAAPTSSNGWFYDDYTVDSESCGVSTAYRVSFTEGDTPPQGARMSFSCAQPVPDGDLEIDLNSACSTAGNPAPGASCVFSSTDAGDAFALRYNLLNREFTYATTAGSPSRFNCEFDSNTCQIACETDAQCPGGFVCYDDPNDDDSQQAGMTTFCVNPVCGTD